jgi:hypothetical protein
METGKGVFVCLLLTVLCSSSVWAQDSLAQENEALKARVGALEEQVQELIALVKNSGTAGPAAGQPASGPMDDASLDKLAKLVSERQAATTPAKHSIWTSLDAQVYGFLRMDMAYDTDSVTDGAGGAFVKNVNSHSTNSGDNSFTATPRWSRVGVKFTGPADDTLKTSGQLEIDFAGGGSDTSANPRLRLGYVNLDWYNSNFSLLAGQTWDLMSPLNPPMIDNGVLWWSGNIGMRRPQIRATKKYDFKNGNQLVLAGAVASNFGGNNELVSGLEIGEDSGIPSLQWRAAMSCTLLPERKTIFGLSGHWGRTEYDTNAAGSNRNFDSWSFNFDLTQPINNWLSISGEMFVGENISQYAGAVGQGINKTALNSIGAKGGWIAATITPDKKWTYNMGYGIDMVDKSDLSAATDITRNMTLFGNAIYAVNTNTDIGMELAYRKTEFQGLDSGDSIRAQMMFKYKF